MQPLNEYLRALFLIDTVLAGFVVVIALFLIPINTTLSGMMLGLAILMVVISRSVTRMDK